MLSHDLFEGLHARVALVSDVELVDEYPSSVLTHARRQHRWIRGDWQILFWLFAFVPSRRGVRRNTLPLIGRWKILDNLRRSLVAPTLVLLAIAGWTILPGRRWFWTGTVVSVLASQLLPLVARLVTGPGRSQSFPVFVRDLWRDTAMALAQILLSATRAPVPRLRHHPCHRRDACASHGHEASAPRVGDGRHDRSKDVGPDRCAGASALRFRDEGEPDPRRRRDARDRWFTTAPRCRRRRRCCCCGSRRRWSPTGSACRSARACARWPATNCALFRRTARRTWRYFETFVTAEDAWLPPDNYQEDGESAPKLARRTSPTNIGMGLLSTLAAHDLGYLTTEALVDRLDRTLTTLEGLERHNGHFLNWYDTATLAPLHPRYVSTVDSGNLAGALIALAQGLDALVDTPQSAVSAARGPRRYGGDPRRDIVVQRGRERSVDRDSDQFSGTGHCG